MFLKQLGMILILLVPLWARESAQHVSSFLPAGSKYSCIVTAEYVKGKPILHTNRQILSRDDIPLTRFDYTRLVIGDDTYKYLRSTTKKGKSIDIYGNGKGREIFIESIRFQAGKIFWFTLYFKNKKRNPKIITCIGNQK
jgi:hypothetical protein